MSTHDRKTCYHCDAVLPEKEDPLDALSGAHGQCANCKTFKADWYADLQQRTGSTPATEQNTP